MAWDDIPDWALHVSKVIMQTVHVKDPQTYSHCLRVSQGSRLLSKALGLNEFEQRVAEFAGLFHDVGKIGVPDEILLKPAKLTDEEYEVMKRHPEKSVEIITPLTHLPFFKALTPGILHHHERVDGLGYPFGLEKDKIPLTARIILIADTFDAMTANRAYRKGLPAEVAYKELRDYSGRQFDPHLVKVFLESQPNWNEKDTKLNSEITQVIVKQAA